MNPYDNGYDRGYVIPSADYISPSDDDRPNPENGEHDYLEIIDLSEKGSNYSEISERWTTTDNMTTENGVVRARSGRGKSAHHRSNQVAHHHHGMDPNDMEMQDMKTLDDDQYYDAVVKRNRTVRELPAPMEKKRELRDKIDDGTNRKLSSYQEWKLGCALNWKRSKENVKNALSYLEVWRGSLKEVEGKFGSAVTSYFVFLKWLMFLNLYIFLLELVFVVIPQSVFARLLAESSSTTNCSYAVPITRDALSYVLSFLEGTGIFEKTELFYGYYLSGDLDINVSGFTGTYLLPLAYILVGISYFGLSLIMIIYNAGSTFRENMTNEDDRYFKFSNKVFGGWDYGMSDVNNAELKKTAIQFDFQAELAEQRLQENRSSRSTSQHCCLYTLRILINFIVVLCLGGSGYLIYFATDFALQNKNVDYGEFVNFLVSYLTSLTITVLNVIVPLIFQALVRWEDYAPQFEINVTLGRTVLLRLASLAVLLASIYPQIHCPTSEDSCGVCTDSNLECWETYLGQEMYKLTLTDFFASIATVVVEFVKMLIGKCCKFGLAQSIAKQEFELPKNVLQLVYSQALCWLGGFFCPLLPAIVVIKMFILFYFKKLSLIVNFQPASRPFRASRSSSFFMILLLVTFMLCLFPIGFAIANVHPSQACGPFSNYGVNKYMWTILVEMVDSWPAVFRTIIDILTSAGFVVLIFVILSLFLYYYYAISNAYRAMVALLKEQLVLESREKVDLQTKLHALAPDDGIHKKSRKPSLAPHKQNPPPRNPSVVWSANELAEESGDGTNAPSGGDKNKEENEDRETPKILHIEPLPLNVPSPPPNAWGGGETEDRQQQAINDLNERISLKMSAVVNSE